MTRIQNLLNDESVFPTKSGKFNIIIIIIEKIIIKYKN